MWWLYFKWQWLRDAHYEHPGWQSLLAALFLVLGLLGGFVHWQRDRRSFWYFGSLMFTMTLFLIYYLNFKYGASQAPDLTGVQREVRDRDYFYLWSFSAWGVWAALGLVAVWESIASLHRPRDGDDRVGEIGRAADASRARHRVAGAGARAHPAVHQLVHRVARGPDRHGRLRARPAQLRRAVRRAHHRRRQRHLPALVRAGGGGGAADVVVANTSLLNTDWYTRQIIRRPVFDYDAANGSRRVSRAHLAQAEGRG